MKHTSSLIIARQSTTLISLFKISSALLILSVLLFGCRTDEDYKPKDEKWECSNVDHSGYQTLVQNSETREYILHIPASYSSNLPTPLVINFHGFGDCAANFAEDIGEFYGLNDTADENNFIIVYPQAAYREKGANYWEPGDTGKQSIEENDVYFTEQLIAEISSSYNVDLSRVYAIGYSNGGMMSYDLACTGSDFIAAVGIMSGISLSEDCDVTNAYTSVIHFHGIDDSVLPYEGNQDYQPVSEVVNYWLDHNGISTASLLTAELNGGDVLREEYSDGNEDTAVALYTIFNEYGKSGGHVWFSDDIDGESPNEILWSFLSKFSL